MLVSETVEEEMDFENSRNKISVAGRRKVAPQGEIKINVEIIKGMSSVKHSVNCFRVDSGPQKYAKLTSGGLKFFGAGL